MTDFTTTIKQLYQTGRFESIAPFPPSDVITGLRDRGDGALEGYLDGVLAGVYITVKATQGDGRGLRNLFLYPNLLGGGLHWDDVISPPEEDEGESGPDWDAVSGRLQGAIDAFATALVFNACEEIDAYTDPNREEEIRRSRTLAAKNVAQGIEVLLAEHLSARLGPYIIAGTEEWIYQVGVEGAHWFANIVGAAAEKTGIHPWDLDDGGEIV